MCGASDRETSGQEAEAAGSDPSNVFWAAIWPQFELPGSTCCSSQVNFQIDVVRGRKKK